MKKKLVLITLISASLLSGIYYYLHHEKKITEPVIWVEASKVKKVVMLEETHAIGTLTAKSVEITSEVGGHVHEILFKDGAEVKKGSPLIQLDNAIFKAKLDSANAKLVFSENNYKRMSLLGKKGVVAKQAVDQAIADLKEKQADAKESAVMLSKMTLVAPFDGVIGKSNVSPGDYVNVGEGLVTMTDIKHLRIEFNLPEKYFSAVKIGQSVTLSSSLYPNKKFIGKISFISPTINTENRSVSLYAEVENPDNLLASGMFVEVTETLGQKENTLFIPLRSLVPILDGEQVFKIVDGKAYAVTVTLGKRDHDEVQVVNGLSKEDMVITAGQMKLKSGMPVKVKS